MDFNGNTINASGAGFRGGGGRTLSGAAGTNKTDFYIFQPLTLTRVKVKELQVLRDILWSIMPLLIMV